jgi:hypothetical protein
MLLAKALAGPDHMPRFIDLAAPVLSGDHVIGVLAAHLLKQWAPAIDSQVIALGQPVEPPIEDQKKAPA